eukprot:TRINITY_DN10349_c0_g1_i2.p1 TRINITY_DN10349_c0_g1~~TRINITY_DN10349_c0_g1_i2.p1  ORF type:complete len:126 (+),score=1.41 TRINITY_DN10349_c0_g1_i2:92-469(+)
MLRSLVGSEMCIRDRKRDGETFDLAGWEGQSARSRRGRRVVKSLEQPDCDTIAPMLTGYASRMLSTCKHRFMNLHAYQSYRRSPNAQVQVRLSARPWATGLRCAPHVILRATRSMGARWIVLWVE